MLTKCKKKSAVLIQGVVDEALFDQLKKHRNEEMIILEGRPGLQAAQSSCRALIKRKLTPTLMADNMAGYLFRENLIKEAWLSYQIADNQGALCDIGALIIAVLGKRHKVPVKCFPAGKRTEFVGEPKDLFNFKGSRIAPKGIHAYVPLVEWVPAKYLTKIYE